MDQETRAEAAAGLLAMTITMVALPDITGAMDTVSAEMAAAMTPEQKAMNDKERKKAARERAEAKAQLAAVLKRHKLPDFTAPGVELPQGEERKKQLAALDHGALVRDLMNFMNTPGEGPGDLPLSDQVRNLKVSGNRATAKAGKQTLALVQRDGRSYLAAKDLMGTPKMTGVLDTTSSGQMSQSQGGRVTTHGSRWFVLGLLWLAAAGCGDDGPTTPTAVTPNFAGTWVGTGLLQQCSGNAAVCGQTPPNAAAPVEFVLAQTGTSVSGTFTINAGARVAIAGSVTSDGSLNLSGRPAGAPVSIDSTRLTVAGSAMSGTLTYSLTSDPGGGTPTITVGLQGVTRR